MNISHFQTCYLPKSSTFLLFSLQILITMKYSSYCIAVCRSIIKVPFLIPHPFQVLVARGVVPDGLPLLNRTTKLSHLSRFSRISGQPRSAMLSGCITTFLAEWYFMKSGTHASLVSLIVPGGFKKI